MKTIFKSLLVAALFVGVGTTAKAQLGTQGSVGANARILKQITITQNDSIRFGTVAAGTQTFLNPQSQASSTNIGFSAAVGRLVVDASQEEPIRITFDSTVVLTRTTNDTSISFVPVISVIHGEQEANTANRTNSVLLSAQAIANPITDVTGPSGNGEGPVGLITTSGVDQRTTLFIGGYLYLRGTRSVIPSNGPQGTFIGGMAFNIIYGI
ncbi:MAG: hypothetical protein Q8J69_03170 [Sphingobacteriaceae bacterium]|nr:hypothetical protein [Sphingobacteriaceae bacterium]